MDMVALEFKIEVYVSDTLISETHAVCCMYVQLICRNMFRSFLGLPTLYDDATTWQQGIIIYLRLTKYVSCGRYLSNCSLQKGQNWIWDSLTQGYHWSHKRICVRQNTHCITTLYCGGWHLTFWQLLRPLSLHYLQCFSMGLF